MKSFIKSIDKNIIFAIVFAVLFAYDVSKSEWFWAPINFVVFVLNVMMSRPVVRWAYSKDEGIGGA